MLFSPLQFCNNKQKLNVESEKTGIILALNLLWNTNTA